MTGDNQTPQPSPNNSKNTYIFIICLFFMLLAFVVAYFLRRYGCLSPSPSTAPNNEPTRVPRGMDATDIASLPSLRFSEIKTHWAKKPDHTQLECAVCLNEFSDQENLRILPDCLHVYHPQCIRPWLTKHATCPVCRASLEHRKGSSMSLSSIIHRFDNGNGNDNDNDNDDNNDDHLTVEIEGSSGWQGLEGHSDSNLHGRLRRSYSMSGLDIRIVGEGNTLVTKLKTLSNKDIISIKGDFKSITP